MDISDSEHFATEAAKGFPNGVPAKRFPFVRLVEADLDVPIAREPSKVPLTEEAWREGRTAGTTGGGISPAWRGRLRMAKAAPTPSPDRGLRRKDTEYVARATLAALVRQHGRAWVLEALDREL